MMMPGRTYTADNSYRYGFNGKEVDKEVKGDGVQYDYGFRIYDSRVGRFLSVDPLTRNYAALTPYQFASNNPIEGIDLDGLEYVSSKDVRIKVTHGRVILNIENMTSVVKIALTQYHEDPKNWAPGEIGADLSVGKINWQSTLPQQAESDVDPSDANPNNKQGETKVETPVAKSTGLPDKRYKEKTVTSAAPAAARGLAIVAIAVDIVVAGANYYVQGKIDKDKGLVDSHIGSFKLAAADVNYALQNTTLIPAKYQTAKYLSDIINVVLSGTTVNSSGTEQAEIVKIGQNIYNSLSIKRQQYTGKLITLGKLDGNNARTVPEPNPSYDAEYVKQNPPLGEQPKE